MRCAWAALSAALLCAMAPASADAATDAATVLKASRERMQTADFRASGHLVGVQANGKRVSYPLNIRAHWFPGVLRIVIELGAAPKTAATLLGSSFTPAHILLEMRPNGQNVIQIAHPG